MAYTNEILVGRVNRGLQKLFGIKGPSPVPQLASDVQAVHPLFNGVENRYLDGWNRFGAQTSQGASVGNISGFRIRNPSTSNVIAVFEKIAVSTSVAGDVFIRIGAQAADLGGGT